MLDEAKIDFVSSAICSSSFVGMTKTVILLLLSEIFSGIKRGRGAVISLFFFKLSFNPRNSKYSQTFSLT